MKWEDCLKEGSVEKRTADKELANSLYKTALERIAFFQTKNIDGKSCRFILEGVYESILELCHSILAINGFKTLSHECAIEFLKHGYLEENEIDFLQRVRKLRHGIKYYGRVLKVSTAIVIIDKCLEIFRNIKKVMEHML